MSVEEADTKELVEQAKSLEWLVVMWPESSVIFLFLGGVSFGLYLCKSFFLLFEFAVVEKLGSQAGWNVPNLVDQDLNQPFFFLDPMKGLAPGKPLLPQ